MKKRIFTVITLSAIALAAAAQDTAEQKEKFSVTPTGRILMDVGIFAGPQKELFKDGVGIPDVRLGAKMKYGKWDAKVDIGYAYGKVGLKDLYVSYTFNPQMQLKFGNFIHQYGLQSATSSSMKPTMEEPISNAVFNDSRQLGAQFEYNGPKFLATASVHSEPSATTVLLNPDQFTKDAFGMRTRLLYRPFHQQGKMLQVGLSGAFATPQRHQDQNGHDLHDGFVYAANFPTRIEQVSAIKADIGNARNLFKLTPELMVNYGPVALETQYFWNHISRKDGFKAYNAQGAYATLRGMLLGPDYTYDMWGGGIATPAPKSLELVLDYNYTSLSDARSGIYGGRLNDFSATLNYYINKYMIVRLHYSYTHTWDRADCGSMTLNGFMARFQVIF